jgi:hypothetical protein
MFFCLCFFSLSHTQYSYPTRIYQTAQPNNDDFLSLFFTDSHTRFPRRIRNYQPAQPNNLSHHQRALKPHDVFSNWTYQSHRCDVRPHRHRRAENRSYDRLIQLETSNDPANQRQLTRSHATPPCTASKQSPQQRKAPLGF